MPLISLIVPYYNTSEDMLRRCLRPFLETDVQGVEVILADDGSSRDYGDAIDRLVRESATPLRLVRRERNGGQNAARAAGIAAATGDYIAFLDSDDYLDAGEFTKVLAAMEETPAEVYGINALAVDTDGRTIYREDITHATAPMDVAHAVRTCAALWHWIVRTDLMRAHPLNQELRIGEDLVSIMPVLASSTSILGIDATPYCYVQHEANTMRTARTEDRLALLDGFGAMLDANPGLPGRFHDEVEWQAVWHLLFWEPLEMLQQDPQAARSYYTRAARWMQDRFPHWRDNRYVHTDPLAQGLRFRMVTEGRYRTYRTVHALTAAAKRLRHR